MRTPDFIIDEDGNTYKLIPGYVGEFYYLISEDALGSLARLVMRMPWTQPEHQHMAQLPDGAWVKDWRYG